MRTTFRIFAAAAAAALGILTSCQQQVLDAPDADGIAGKELVPVTLTASFIQTKADYTETLAKNLQPVWEADDKVIGFDEDSNNYEFTVASVAADGSATLTGEAPANCTLHLIYLCGANKDEITSGSLSVSYDGQAGDKTMPAVMLADGNVFFGAGEFHFSNAGAVIGIDAVKGVPNSSTVSKITVYGDNLSAATIALSGSTLALTADGSTEESISTGTLSGVTVTDGIGTLSEQVLIAVPAGAKVKEVSVEIDSYIYSYALTTPATLAANQYSYVAGKTFIGHEFVEIAGKKWATMNVGATTVAGSYETCYGDYFAWGATEPYYTSISFTSANAATINGWKSGKEDGYDWPTAPFNNGSSDYNSDYFTTNKSEWLTDNVLKPAYDAATVNWGSSWRMPTVEDFKSLWTACTGYEEEWYCEPAPLPETITDGGVYWSDSYDGVAGILFVDKSDISKRVFFPAAGHVYGTSFGSGGADGYSWSSSLNTDDPDYAYRLCFYDWYVGPSSSSGRYVGFTVRPVVK